MTKILITNQQEKHVAKAIFEQCPSVGDMLISIQENNSSNNGTGAFTQEGLVKITLCSGNGEFTDYLANTGTILKPKNHTSSLISNSTSINFDIDLAEKVNTMTNGDVFVTRGGSTYLVPRK